MKSVYYPFLVCLAFSPVAEGPEHETRYQGGCPVDQECLFESGLTLPPRLTHTFHGA